MMRIARWSKQITLEMKFALLWILQCRLKNTFKMGQIDYRSVLV